MEKPERFDRFSEEAKQTLLLAQAESHRFNHNYIGTEHLLLGIVRQEGSLAAQVLESLGVQLEKVRGAVEFIIGRGDRLVLGEIGLTPRGKLVLKLAIDEAQRFNHKEIGPEHILLGLVREGEGIAASVLESVGVNLERIRGATLRAMSMPVSQASRPQPAPDPDALSSVSSLVLGVGRYKFYHLDAEQRERRAVGSGAHPRPIPVPPHSAVPGTRLGWVTINTGGAFTLSLYDGFDTTEPFAIISNPPIGARFPYHTILKQGLTYTLEGTPGSITILYEDVS